MDDLNAFERQVAGEFVRRAGPVRPVDAAAIFSSLAATQSPKRRFQPMFSAAKFVVASAIVALFGGFLLAGMLTQPSDEALPAAASPTTATPPDLLPGVNLETEEVEPGVYRIVTDGTSNDLAIHATVNGGDDAQVIAGQDGSVWVRDSPTARYIGEEVPQERDGLDRLFRLGIADTIDASRLHDYWPDISVASDGTLWALGDSALGLRRSGAGDAQVFSLNDGEWTAQAVPEGVTVTGIETPADGSVWISQGTAGPSQDCPGDAADRPTGGRAGVARLVDGEWVEEDVEPAVRAGDGGGLAVGPDGTALLETSHFTTCPDDAWTGIMERTEDGWARSFTSDMEADAVRAWSVLIAIGSDGSAWAYQSGSAIGKGLPTWSPRLLRQADGDWEVLGDDGSVPALTGAQEWDSRMTVSPDGRLWIALGGPWVIDTHRVWGDRSIAATLDGLCAGVLSYDGTSWGHHLAGACVSDVSAAPNGDVWVTVLDIDPAWIDDLEPRLREAALTSPSPPAGIYVVTPKAVSTAAVE